MKRLIIMCAIAIAGFAANATAVAWNTGALYLPNADGTWGGTKATDKTVGSWAIAITFYADNEGVKGDALTGITGISSSTMSSLGAMSGTTSDSFVNGTKYWVDAIVTYTSAAGVQTMNSLDGYFTITKGTGNQTVNFQATAALNQKIFVKGTTNFTAVPEPTSAMLLLLGVAGMALRRRRA